MNIFCSGLGMKSALNLDIAAGGLFAQITPTEGREILDFSLSKLFIPYQPQRTHPTRVRVAPRGVSSS